MTSSLETLTEDNVQILYELGLTRLQVEAFLALLRLGSSTPAQIARACSFHRVEGYRVMRELNKLGLVEQRLSEKKSTFSAISPRSMLSSLISIRAEELRRLKEKTAQFIPVLESLNHETNDDYEAERSARFRIMLGHKQSSEMMARLWRIARHEILLMLPRTAYFFADKDDERLLKSTARRKVRVNVIVELDNSNLKVVQSLRNKCNVRCYDRVPTDMAIVDGSQIIFGGYPQIKDDVASMTCLWTDSTPFIYSMKQFFEQLWRDSYSVEQKIASIKTGKLIPRTEVVRSRAEIDSLLSDVIGRAKNRLLISLGNSSESLIPGTNGSAVRIKDLAEAQKRGLRSNVLMKIDDHSRSAQVEEISRIADVKHCDQIPFTAVITDFEMVVCTVVGTGPEEVLWVTAKDMVDKFYLVAKAIFTESKNASMRLWEIKTGTQIGEGLFRQIYSSNERDGLVSDQPEIETTLTRSEGNRIYRKMPGITYYKSFDPRTSRLQAGYAVLEPGSDSGLYFHPGEEAAIVIKGTLTLDVNKDTFTLNEGDTIHYRSDVPHRMRNLTSSEKVKVFTVSYPPTF